MTFIPVVLTTNDNNNSTTTTLGVSGVFTGVGSLTTGFGSFIITIKSDVDSASGGIDIQFSNDNVTYDTFYSDTYISSGYFTKSYQILKKYYRVIYTNESSSQSSFELTSRLSVNNSDNITNNSITTFNNDVESSLDAFGKLRVSMPNTLLDIRFPSNSIASGANSNFLKSCIQICSKSSGSYSATYEKSKAIIAGTNSGYYISQSRNYVTYQPGKSLLFISSCLLNPSNTNFISRIGYFDNEFTTNASYPTVYNGLYFQYNNGNISVNVANNSSTISITQSSWNVDKMNGMGTSGLNLDFTKGQLFVIDMEWLSIGRVRFGFYAYGRIQYCHQIINFNTLISPYSTNINLPICCTLHSTNGSAGSGTIRQICSTVISEGGYNPVGKPFSVSNSQENVNSPVTVSTVETPLLAIRGGGVNYYHQNIVPKGMSIIDTATNNNLLYRLRLYTNGSSPGTITWSSIDSNYSVTQYAKSADISSFTTSGSLILDQGYFYGRGTIAYNNLSDVFSDMILHITSNIDNVSDILILSCEKIGTSSTTVYSTISWQEIY